MIPENPPDVRLRVGSAGCPTGDQPTSFGEASETFNPTLATDAIYDNIDATLAGQLPHFFRKIGFFVIDPVASAKVFGPGDFRVAAGGDEYVSADMGGELQCSRSYSAADADNQNMLAGLELCVGDEHSPERNIDHGKRPG